LSHYVEAEFATALLQRMTGGVGYLLKDRILTPSTLSDALIRITAGECVVDPALVATLMAQQKAAGPLTELTQRERGVLTGVAEGLSGHARKFFGGATPPAGGGRRRHDRGVRCVGAGRVGRGG